MNCINITRVIAAFICVLFSTPAQAGSAEYVGSQKCKMCHNTKKDVQQFSIWQNSAHSGAYQTLSSDLAKEFALKAGVEGNPQEAGACLECHVTGYGSDSTMFAESFNIEDGIQCESCHGPGSEYKSIKIMSKSKYASQRDVQHELALKAGLVVPEENICLKCHNERSPAFKGFDYKTYYEKIKHEYEH
ncbi:MAG: cytochrome c family protein [candidate division Zixibacteria bacterium]